MTLDLILGLVAAILVILAGLNIGSPYRLEWLGIGLFLLTLVF
jgi:hypothetical protein